jgi:hypothetical protein
MNDKFTFKLDMSRAKDRITLRKLMRQIVKEVMDNGDYLSEVIIDRNIDNIPMWDKKVILGHLVRGADIILRFDCSYGKGRAGEKSHQSDKDKKRP